MVTVRVRRFIKDSAILALSNAGVRCVSFLLLPVYTSALSPEALGVTDLVLNSAWLLSAALSLGMGWGMQSFFHDGDGEPYQRRLVSTCFAFFACAAVIALLPIPLARPIAAQAIGDGSQAAVVVMGFGFVAASLLWTPMETAARMRGRTKAVAALNLTRVGLTVAATLAAIFILRLGAQSIVFANLVAMSATAALYVMANRCLLSPRAIDPGLLRSVFLCSWPVVFTSLLSWVNDASDRWVVAFCRSQAEVGLYGVAARLTGTLWVFAWGITMAYAPFASANAGDPASRPKFLAAFDLNVLFLSLVCFPVSVFSREIVSLMAAPVYREAYVAVPFLLYGVALYALVSLLGYSFNIKKAGGLCLLVNSVCAASNLAMNLVLVPRFGFLAAAWTTLVSYLLGFAITALISERIFPRGYDLRRLTLALVPPAALCLPLHGAGTAAKAGACLVVAVYACAIYADRVRALWEGGLDWLARGTWGAPNA